jgi:hypothetical protein
VSGAVNFNPAINFNTTTKTMSGISGAQQTIFAVRNISPTVSYHTLFAGAANTDFSIRTSGTFDGITNLNYTG